MKQISFKPNNLRSKIASFLFFFLITVICYQASAISVYASHCPASDYDCQIAEIQKEIDSIAGAHENNKKELSGLNAQLSNLKKRITGISTELTNIEKQMTQREDDLAFARNVFDAKAQNHYKFLRVYDPMLPFLATEDATEALRQFNFRSRATDEDRKTMEKYAADLSKLKSDKEGLEKNKASLAAAQANVDSRAKFLTGEVAKVESYIATLSAKQTEILNAKSGSFTASVGDSELADDRNASIKGFREDAPGGSFAVFSFGGYTHRKGMSQYGARGRAQNGQNFRDILRAYYGKEPVSKDTSGTISVTGVGAVDFEGYYLLGIAEMPSSWHPEALKAQAIAARTYAYRYKVQGTSICTTEACQVFRASKAANAPAEWRAAVEATRGLVLEDVVTYYSSTSGGFSTTSGWDTTDGQGGSTFFDRSYEKLGGSPWAYKAWYRDGYTSSGATCGRGNPWLSGSELADLVNAAIAVKDNKVDSRVTPLTTSCWGGNPYSAEELKNLVGGVSNVTSVQVLQGNGSTNEVVINGSIRINGNDFKKGFNLRAPGYLRIPQSSFAFFNIESK